MKTNITNTYTVVPMIFRRVLKVTIDKKKEHEQTEKTIHVPIEGDGVSETTAPKWANPGP
jgi:hypothetical protein